MTPVRDIAIADDMIRLGQLLKLAGVIESGADAKAALEAGHVRVNNQVENRRGRQLAPGDVVAWRGRRLRVVKAGSEPKTAT